MPLKTLEVGKILSQVPKQVWRKKTLKKTKKKENKAEVMRPECVKRCCKALFLARRCDAFQPMCGAHVVPIQLSTVFSLWVWGKVQFFNPNPVGNLRTNTRALVHNYSFRTWQFKKKANARSLNGGVSRQPLFWEYVLFLLLYFLVNMSN